MDKDRAELLIQMVGELDELIASYTEFESHSIAGVLLSRVVLLMSQDPETGKELVKYIWERLDEIEQANPGGMI